MSITKSELNNNLLDILDESLKIVPFYYSYPEEFNIIPATIYFDNKKNKIIKRPREKWTKDQSERYPRENLKGQKHLCVVCGEISNNLLVFDFDKDLSNKLSDNQTYKNIIAKHPLLDKNPYVVKTMNGGFHFYFFLESVDVYENLREQEINTKAQKTGLKTDIKGIKEIDLRCEGNIVLTHPSKYKDKKYELWLTKETFRPLKIANKEFLDILKSITTTTTPKTKKETKLSIGSIIPIKVDDKKKLPKVFDSLLQCHKDVLSHKIDIAKYCRGKEEGEGGKGGGDEFEYWKDLFWQVYTKTGLTHESLYPYLKKQSHFNINKIETQLKYDYHNYKFPLKTKDNPNGKFIKASVKKLYPDYPKKQPKKKKVKKDEYVYDSYKIADLILKTYTIKTLGSKRPDYCLYKNGVYERGQLTSIETIISNTLRELEIPYSLTKNYELLKLIANETYINIKEFDKNEMVLNLSNGLLNVETLELMPHTPEYLSFRRIPITYNPKVKCPKIRKFLKEIFHSKDIKYILEKIGLSLTPIMIFQDGTFLFGTGNNGKTTFYNLLRSLLESNNYSGVDLVKLDSFIFSQIENKLANIVSDIDSSQNINIQNYKIYVGNELVVYINRKFIEPYQIPPTAKMWYSCNTSFPQVPLDTDKGFWRKITIIECPFEFDNIESLNILEELTTPEELSGFLNLAIRNLRTLLRRGKFSPRYTDWEYYKDFWLTKNNLFGQFVEETMLIGSQYYTDKQETLKCMNTWLAGNGKTPITDKKLTSMIKGIPKYYHERLSIDGKQTWVYTGFSIQDNIKNIPDFYLKKRKKLKTKIIDDFKK